MQPEFLKCFKRMVSEPRFNAFRGGNGNPDTTAVSRYVWNIALCEALYPAFQILEVSFRNALHVEIAAIVGSADWLTSAPRFLYATELDTITSAKAELQTQGKRPTEPYLVSQLKFGFWTSLLDSRYDKVWHKVIKGVFPGMPRTIRTRGEASSRMNTVRRLRNAALHHHSIWHWNDLEEQHRDCRTLIAWLGESGSVVANSVDRFPEVFKSGPQSFHATVSTFKINVPPASP